MSSTAIISYTIKDTVEHLEVIKNSKFYVKATPVTNIDDALSYLKTVQDTKASHNCWAFRSSAGYERFSDDGEPGGTAGRPILSAMEGESIVDVVVVITRFFGGIKLGTGGLVRAYGDAARNCLRQGEKVQIIPLLTVECECNMSSIGSVYYILSSIVGYIKLSEQYKDDNAIITARIPVKDYVAMDMMIRDKGRGQISLRRID